MNKTKTETPKKKPKALKKVFKKVLKFLILAIPYLIFMLRTIVQLLDEFTQEKSYKLANYLDLLETQDKFEIQKQETIKQQNLS